MADYTIDPSGLDDVEAASVQPYGRLPNKQDLKTVAGYGGKLIASIPAMPTGLYSLASDILKAGTKATIAQDGDAPILSAGRNYLKYMMPFGVMNAAGFDRLPGAEGAREFTDKVDRSALGFGSNIAGRELQPGISPNVDNTAADKIGTGIDILGSLIPITGGPIKTGFEALKNINTGIKAIDKTVPIAGEVAKFLTPLVPTDSARALIAGNAVIGGAAQLAHDSLSTPDPNNAEADPAFKLAMDQFIQDTTQAHAHLNEKAADHAAVAIDSVGQVSNDIHAVQAGFIPEDYQGLAAAAFSIALGGAVAYTHRDVIRGASLRFLGGKEFSKDAALDFVTKPDATTLSVADVAKSQGVNAAIPLLRNTANPEHMQAMFENIGAAKDVHFTSLMDNGQFANSRVRLAQPMSEFVDYMRDKIGSDPVKHQLFQDTANAISELGNRNRAWLGDNGTAFLRKQPSNSPTTSAQYRNWLNQGGDELKYAFNMNDKKYGDLEAIRNAGLVDPDIQRGVAMYADITKKALQYRVEQGANTLREYNDLIRAHPTYFPVRQAGSHMSPLELSEGAGRISVGDPIKELMPYLEQTVREVAEEKLRTAFILEAKARNASFLGKELSVNDKNVMNRDKMVNYRDANANPKMIEVTDPMIRAALEKGAGSGMIRLNQGLLRVLSIPSRILETLTTHPLTAVVGSPFAVGNAAYGGMATIVNRQAGMRAGWIDGFVQEHGLLGANKQGINRGFRGDLTFPLVQVPIQAAQSFVARLAQYGGKAIENSVQSSWLAPSLGQGTLQKLGAAMSNHYKSSMVHELNTQGLHGGATAMGRAQTYTLKDLENALTPATRASEGWKATSNFAWDLFRAIGDAPQAAYYKQNKGRISQELLTTRVRNVMGDPSKAGLGTSGFGQAALQGVILHPWGSVTLQSFSKLLESAHQNPLGTAVAIGNAIVIPSILVSNWNMSLGSEYVDYQHNRRTPDQVAGSLYFGIPGRPPEEGLEWRIDQPMRPFKVLADVMYGHQYGLYDGSIFKPENEFARRAIVDGVATRYGIWGWGDAMKSALGQVAPAIPPIVTGPANMMGVNIRSYTEGATAIADRNKNAGASDSTSKVIDNKWFGYPISANMEATLQNTGGQIGQAIYEMLTAHFQGKKDGLSAQDQLSDYQDRFGMRLGQSSREVSGLWGHAATLSPSQESSAKALTEQMDSIRKLDAASQKLRGLSGSGDLLSGSKGRQIDSLAGSGPVKFADQQMAALAYDAQRFVAVYDRQFSGRLKDLYEQRSSILSSEKVAPDVKRTMMNDNARQIVDSNRAALSALEQWKWTVSKAYNRDIDPRNIKLDQPITQFKQLLQ